VILHASKEKSNKSKSKNKEKEIVGEFNKFTN